MNEQEFKTFMEQLGPQLTSKLKTEFDNYGAKVKQIAEEAVKNGGMITEKSFNEYKEAAGTALQAVKDACVKQGTTLEELSMKLNGGEMGTKGIAEQLKDDQDELRKIYENRGVKTYLANINAKGQWVMKPVDMTKTAGPNASIAGINGGSVASISQALDAATLLRVGAGAMIQSQYRNTTWIFDLCNTINASFNAMAPFVMWFDEQPKAGTSATTAEGASRNTVQYIYQLNSSTYQKESALVGFSEEFQMDFAQLESDIMNKARIDVINRVNQAILPDIINKATAYNQSAAFKGSSVVANVNDYDAIAACAAQVDNATFGARANAAIMGTNKKYRMGITKNTQGSYLNPPDVLSGIAFVGNPSVDTSSMGADGLIVGDLKQYNIILRGGLIVKVGYNGNDFGNGLFSTVLDQFYFNYISTVRKPAIVGGPDFATVKGAISA